MSDQVLVPKLRFQEFRKEGAWTTVPIGKASQHIQERVGNTKLIPVSISAGEGFVSQASKFGRDISGEQYKNYVRINRGDFAYNKGNSKRYPQGCVYMLREFDQAAAPYAFVCFRLKSGFAPAYFQALFEKNAHGRQLTRFITSGARSDGLLNVSSEEFFSVEFPLPPVEDEQRRIGDCLTSLDELIAAEGQKLQALRRHKKGLLQQLFPRPERTENGKTIPAETTPRLRFPEFRGRGEWAVKKLGDLGTLIGGLTYSPADVQEDGLLVLRSSNIQNGEISLEDCVYVRRDVKGANLSEPDDILICVRNGSKSLIGKSAMIPSGLPDSTHGAFMTVFRASAPHFASTLLQSSAFYKQVAADLGATINSINVNQLLRYRFTVPEPAEQQRIADCLSSIDEFITAQAKKVELLRTHKRGLMQGLFPKMEDTTA